jgi:hypothetical protein
MGEACREHDKGDKHNFKHKLGREEISWESELRSEDK